MPKGRLTVSDPHFNEFVFACIVNATVEQKAKLPFDLYDQAQSPGKAKTFVDTSSLDKKLAMLSYLGISFSIWAAPPAFMSKETLAETARNFKENRLESVNEMVKSNSFVFGDREIMSMLVMMGSNCHNETYMLNRDYYQLSKEITSLDEVKGDTADAVKAAISEFKLLCKFSLHMLLQKSNHTDGFTRLNELDLAILIYVFIHRQEAVEQRVICDYLYPAYQRNRVNITLLHLVDSFYLNRFPATRKYFITAKGIQAIGSYMMRLTNHTFSF